MAKGNMRQAFIEAVIEAAEASSMREVHVAKLIKQLGVNRNTFYYHFASKYDVALQIFREDIAAELEAEVPVEELLRTPLKGDGSGPLLPYFVHRELGARNLDAGDFNRCLARCVTKRPRFYSKLFCNRDQEFRVCFEELYRPALQDDLFFMLGGRYLPQETQDYILDVLLGRVFHLASYHLLNPKDSAVLLDDRVNPFWNGPYESLQLALQRHTVNRIRR